MTTTTDRPVATCEFHIGAHTTELMTLSSYCTITEEGSVHVGPDHLVLLHQTEVRAHRHCVHGDPASRGGCQRAAPEARRHPSCHRRVAACPARPAQRVTSLRRVALEDASFVWCPRCEEWLNVEKGVLASAKLHQIKTWHILEYYSFSPDPLEAA
jgi:hypothetical protein